MEEEQARPRSSSSTRLEEREREILLSLNCIVLELHSVQYGSNDEKMRREQKKKKKKKMIVPTDGHLISRIVLNSFSSPTQTDIHTSSHTNTDPSIEDFFLR
jgi:hypothetical protein